MTLVDTSSLVHFLRRKGDRVVKDRVRGILKSGDAAICPVIEVELWMGVGSPQDERDVADLVGLMIGLPIDGAVWTEASRLARECRKMGNPVPSSDLIVAATAFVHHASIEAEDKHFDLLQSLRK